MVYAPAKIRMFFQTSKEKQGKWFKSASKTIGIGRNDARMVFRTASSVLPANPMPAWWSEDVSP